MIVIDSNVGAVAGKIERFLTRFSEPMRAVMRPTQSWLPVARRRAEMALEAVASPTERQHIPMVVRTVMVEVLGTDGKDGVASMVWTAGKVGRAISVLEAAAGGAWLGPLFGAGDRDELKDLVRAWVRTPEDQGGKRKDARDIDTGEEETMFRILRVLDRFRGSEFDLLTAQSVARRLEEFARSHGATKALPPEVLDRWLRAILAAWEDLLTATLGPLAREALNRHWRNV